MGPARAGAVAAAALLSGCAGAGARSEDALEKLRRAGLEAVSAEEARLPAGEAERFLACRVVPGYTNAPVPEHPAGYLIVGLEGRPAASRDEILRAVAARSPGDWLTLTIRRNPHLGTTTEWYEIDVPVRIR